MIDLFYCPTPNGWKVSIALAEMGLPFKLHEINIGKGDQFQPAFLEIARDHGSRRARRCADLYF